MQTPLTDVLLSSEFKDVYPPSEDSFLFLDALEADVNFLKSVKPCVSLEVGSGSGIISTFLCNANLGVCFHICTDVCPAVCRFDRLGVTS
ncbi:eRF1 methyltransferase catalytic subunit mtq2 [Clonorchis sinensis]|uniref:ERF1 methyltransferase catalytic subunit mtq2 n=1 Tax=Clonorchis sinensis TaxID=79923 RepID=G7YIK2_CLOSI|nr:eRF1 methyltransferase catalytic subunit mtq2 [Clonorchis sinensis]